MERKKITLIAISLLLMTLYLGCGKISISEPAEDGKLYLTNNEIKLLKMEENAQSNIMVQQKWITRVDGGVVSNASETVGLNAIYFSPNALPQDTLITFAYNPDGAIADLEPHGIQFQNTVKLQLSYKSSNIQDVVEDNLRIWYFNDDTGMWELIGGTVDKQNKVVVTNINHFSRYAIGDLP